MNNLINKKKMESVLYKDFEEQERKNREKYGSKENDLISECYRKSVEIGDTWVLVNAKKYLDRFLSKSSKGGNLIDLLKAVDYVARCYMFHKGNNSGKLEEIIDQQNEKSFVQKEFENGVRGGRDMDKDRLKEAFHEVISDQHSGIIPYQQGVNDFNNGGVQMTEPLKHFGNQIDASEYLEGFDDAERKYQLNNLNNKKLALEEVKNKVKENSINEKFGDSYEENK